MATEPDAPAHFELRLQRLWITGLVVGSVSFDDPTGGRRVRATVIGLQDVNSDGSAAIRALWARKGGPVDPR